MMTSSPVVKKDTEDDELQKKINEEGEATAVVRCAAACVTEFGEDTRALSVLLTYLKAQAPEDK